MPNSKGAKAPSSTERSRIRRERAKAAGLVRLTIGDCYATPEQVAEMRKRIAVVIAEVLSVKNCKDATQ